MRPLNSDNRSFLGRNGLILLLAFIKFIIPFLLQHPMYEMHRDEFLYLEQGNHLAWGYMECPPLLALFAWFTQLLGADFFWVKFWPALFGGLNVIVVCIMTRELGGKIFAQLIAGLCLITGAYLRVNYLFQPNFLEIFFWSLSAYYLIRLINSQNNRYFYLLAIALALGFVTKYSVSFFIMGIAGGLILTKHWNFFLNKHLYFAGFLGLLIILPNLLWQYQHQWPVIAHMKELRETQLQFISPLTFLFNQVLMHLPYAFIWLGGLIWLFSSKAAASYRIIAWMYLIILIVLMATSGKDYYTLGAYPMLFAAGGVWFERFTAKKYYLRFIGAAAVILLFLPIIPAALPVWKPDKLAEYYKWVGFDKSGMLKWEDLKEHPLPQDFADMICWKEMGDKMSKAYRDLPDTMKNKTMIYCRSYAQAGAITYFGKDLPQVMSDNGSFLLWMPESYDYKHVLFVGRRIPGSDDEAFQQFEKYSILDSISNPLAREVGVKIIFYQNGNDSLNAIITRGIKEMKDEFRR